ncbi:MAG: DUF6265 family protein [Longimicrobiales bacterium]
MRLPLIMVGLSLFSAVPTAAQQAQSLDAARWLAGCWELRAGNRMILEMWMPPAGDLMLGGSRTVVGGKVRDFEQVRIRAEAGKLVYTAVPSGQKEASFPSASITDNTIVFENLAHDFPQRIIYRKLGADSLVARTEGPGANGPRSFDFPMRRVSCT